MALTITDNFDLGSKKPIEKRDEFNSIADMKAYSESFLNEGHVSMVNVGTSANPIWKRYEWRSSNADDSTLGRWREFNGSAKILMGNVDTLGVITFTDSSVTELKDGLYILKFASAVGSDMNTIIFNNNSYYLNYQGSHSVGGLHNIVLAGDSATFYLSGTEFNFISVDGGNGRQLEAASSTVLGGIKVGSISDWDLWDSDIYYPIEIINGGSYKGHTYIYVPKATNILYGTVKISNSTQFASDVADNSKKDLYVPTLLAVKDYVDNAVSGVTVGVATSATLGTIKVGHPDTEDRRAVHIVTTSGDEHKDKAYITLQYASDSNAGIIKTSSSISDDSSNSQVKYPLKSSSNVGYVPVPYASSNNRGVVQLSNSSTINTDLTDEDDTKAVTPKALATYYASKIWVGTQAQYDAIVTKDANMLYFIKES